MTDKTKESDKRVLTAIYQILDKGDDVEIRKMPGGMIKVMSMHRSQITKIEKTK